MMGLAGPAIAVIAGLALIGGLAAACFAKAFGIVFLGEPRGDHGLEARDPGPAMRWPMAILAAGCLLIGLAAPCIAAALLPAVLVLADPAAIAPGPALVAAFQPLTWVVGGGAALIVGSVGLLLLRRRLLAGRAVGQAATWDCGYARPTARMQYTASSFAQPIVEFFGAFLGTRRRLEPPEGLFPAAASLATDTPDRCTTLLYGPLFRFVERLARSLHRLQAGSVHLYILYIAITLIVLLVWKLS